VSSAEGFQTLAISGNWAILDKTGGRIPAMGNTEKFGMIKQ
jgi:hypothetical protein